MKILCFAIVYFNMFFFLTNYIIRKSISSFSGKASDLLSEEVHMVNVTNLNSDVQLVLLILNIYFIFHLITFLALNQIKFTTAFRK